MQNLKDVLKETKDSENTTPRSSGEQIRKEDSGKLLPGVNFIHGDIFDVVSTVRNIIIFSTRFFLKISII